MANTLAVTSRCLFLIVVLVCCVEMGEGQRRRSIWWSRGRYVPSRRPGRVLPRPPPRPVPRPPARPTETDLGLRRVGICDSLTIPIYEECPTVWCLSPENRGACCMRPNYQYGYYDCSCHPRVECQGSQETSESDSDESDDETSESDSDESDDETSELDSDESDGETRGSQNDEGDDGDESNENDGAEETTTPAPRSLCQNQNRILNAEAVDDPCEYRGIANVTTLVAGNEMMTCNAVYVVATVQGTSKATFLTSRVCTTLIDQVEEDDLDVTVSIYIGNRRYPATPPIFSTVEGPNGNAFIDINPRFMNLFRSFGTCQREACPYNPDTMEDEVDMQDCKVVSWGSSEAGQFTFDGLNEAAVRMVDDGCDDIDDIQGASNTMCVRTTSGENLSCINDAAAPVYCRAPSTDEWVLMGVLALQVGCDVTPEAKVLPFPL